MYGTASLTKSLANKYPGVMVSSFHNADIYVLKFPDKKTVELSGLDLVQFKSEAELLAWVEKQLEANNG